MQEKAIKIIKEEIEKKGIKVIKIILFGSRSRNDFVEDSDWDFFVVVDRDLDSQLRHEIYTKIYLGLAKLKGSYEIILKPVSSFEKMKNITGCVSYDADKEGIIVWKS